MSDSSVLSRISDSSLHDLFGLRLEIGSEAVNHSIEGLYLRAMISYLQGDELQLRMLLSEIESSPWFAEREEAPMLKALIELRKQIRSGYIRTECIERCLELLPQYEAWRGECLFVIANAYSKLKDHGRASRYYLEASQAMERLGAKKAAVRALLNHIASESCVDSERRMFSEHFFVYRKARRLGVNSTAAIALLNISREYQKLGALESALKYSRRALALVQDSTGSLSYYWVRLQLCDLLIDLGRFGEARIEYQHCLVAKFEEVQASLKVTAKKLGRLNLGLGLADVPASPGQLTPVWVERLSNLEPRLARLGEIEDRLVRCLSSGARTKFEMIEHLYGMRIDFTSAETRLKTLLSRMRKKYPGLVIRHGERYQIGDEAVLASLRIHVVAEGLADESHEA